MKLRKKCIRNIVEGIRRKTYGTCDKCTSGRYYGWKAMISIMTDITEKLKREEILKHEAEYDSLTGLNNRKNAVSLMEKEFNRKSSRRRVGR